MELSVCVGVAGCLCTISLRVVQIGSAFWPLLRGAPNYASATDPIKICIMFNTVCIAPFIYLGFLKFW